MNYPNFNKEIKLHKAGFNFIAGLDEVGRGPLAGPVLAAAVLLKSGANNLLKGINDSKKISEKQRNYFYDILINNENIEWGIGIVSEKIIDKINILEATKLAMRRAVEQLQKKVGGKIDYLVIDGNFKINSDIPQKSFIKGDQKVLSISVASIIAKVSRDKIMEKIDKKYPKYKFCNHKGYGTSLHFEMIEKYGPCPIHRLSFFPFSKV
jgi:ribonuclease HII